MTEDINESKFQFDVEFQEEVLQLTATDLRHGQRVISLYEDHYFTLVEHSIVAAAFKAYFSKNGRIPSKTVLKEELKLLYQNKQYKKLVMEEDKDRINKVINRVYKGVVKDPLGVYEKVKVFCRYIAFRDELDRVDLRDFSSYESSAKAIQKAITKGAHLEEAKGIFIVEDARVRLNSRHSEVSAFPTPFWQLNRLLNGGGTTMGNIITVLGPAKRFKTGFLLNLARGYMRLRSVVLIVDMENGEDALSFRYDQSILGVSYGAVASGELDDKLLKTLRKYKRFGAECIIKRFPAGTTPSQMGLYIDILREDYNLKVEHLLLDYADLAGSSTGEIDDVKRISNVYIELKNLGEQKQLKSIWTPSHVTREGDKNQGKKYKANDVAKALDKIRHADLIMGMNQSEDEQENNVIRLEVVDQRNGPQSGRVLMHVNHNFQRLVEFSREEVRSWEDQMAEAENAEPTHQAKFKDTKKNDL